jgi:hypothetical protein
MTPEKRWRDLRSAAVVQAIGCILLAGLTGIGLVAAAGEVEAILVLGLAGGGLLALAGLAAWTAWSARESNLAGARDGGRSALQRAFFCSGVSLFVAVAVPGSVVFYAALEGSGEMLIVAIPAGIYGSMVGCVPAIQFWQCVMLRGSVEEAYRNPEAPAEA